MSPRAAAEFGLFLLAAIAGTYGFGKAFQGQGLWLAVSAVALVVIAKQMARIQDRWPLHAKALPSKPDAPVAGREQPRAKAQDARIGRAR